MKEIPITKGKVAIVDDEDFEKLNQSKWFAHYNGQNWYAKRSGWSNTKTKYSVYMHREIMNAPSDMQVDHKNGDPLDNRKENLRLCTSYQNQHNRIKAKKNNKFGIKGVYWNKKGKKFHAQIRVNNKRIHLGFFNVLGDADSAYRKAEEKYFEEFARGNNNERNHC